MPAQLPCWRKMFTLNYQGSFKKILHMQERPKRHGGAPLYLCFHRQNEVGQKRPYHLSLVCVLPMRWCLCLLESDAISLVDSPIRTHMLMCPAAAVPLTATFRFGAHVGACRPGFRPPEMMRSSTMRLCRVMIKAHLR